MLLVIIVLIVTHSILYFSTVKELEEECINAMHEVASKRNDKPNEPMRDDPFKPKDDNKPPKHSYFTTYIIDYDESNDTYVIDGFNDNKQQSIGDEENVDRIKKYLEVNGAKA